MAIDGTRQPRHDALYLGALLALVLLFFGPAGFQPDGMWYAPGATHSDLAITHWPSWQFVVQTVRRVGQIPLWRPSILGGAPLVSNPLAALFYPPNWLALLLPLTASFHVQYALHACGAGAALYALARWGYGRSPFAAFVGGLGYALTPKWIAHMGAGHVGLCQAYAWLPLIAWALRAYICSRGFHTAKAPVRSPLPGAKAAGLKEPSPLGHVERRPQPRSSGQGSRPRPGRSMETAATGSGKLLACAAALALAYLADPRVAFYGAGMAGLYALYRLAGAWRRLGARPTLSLALSLAPIPLVFLLLAAIQVLPTAELAPMTTRAAITLEEAGQDSLPWRYLLGYLIADRGGYHEWMTYLGLLPLGLSGLAVWRNEDRDRWFWAGLALLTLLYALGTNGPLFPLLYRLLPVLGWVRVPSRATLLIALSANLLAAFGVDALLAGRWPLRARRWARRLALTGGLTCAGLGIAFATLYRGDAPPAIYALSGVGAGAYVAWLLGLWPRVPRPLVEALLTMLLIVDLWPVGRSLLELRSAKRVWGEGADVAAYLAEKTASGTGGPSRIYSPSYSVPQHVAARLGLELLDGVEPAQLSWVAGYASLAGGYPLQGYSVTQPPFPPETDVRTAWQDATPDAALLGALNVCDVAAEFPIESPGLVLEAQFGSTYLYANQRCLPRAYLVSHVEPVGGWQEAHSALKRGFDPSQGALVEGGQALNGPAGTQPAIVHERTPNRIVVETEAVRSSLLVLAEVWAPGWRVTVDGAAHPSYRVNGVARGVYLEPGAHTVVWGYRPASLRWGAAVTLCALFALAVGAIGTTTRFSRRRSRDRPR